MLAKIRPQSGSKNGVISRIRIEYIVFHCLLINIGFYLILNIKLCKKHKNLIRNNKYKNSKKFIKEMIGFIFRFSGLSILIRELFCRNKVTIIFYHNPVPYMFKKHIEYFSKHYNYIPLNRLVNAISIKDWSGIPPKALVITIDDGNKDNYNLLNLFKTYHIYPTIYLCSHIVNTNRKFWWEAGFHNFEKLNRCDNNHRLKVLKDAIGYEPQKEYLERQALNIEELKEMMPYVDFQSHSKFHPILTTCTDEECKEEIKGSKDYLENLLNKKIEHFCCPNGDYSDREIKYFKKCGYKSARTFDIGWNYINSDPYKSKAMYIEDDASVNILCTQLAGLFSYVRFLRFGSFKGIHPPFI